MRVSSPGRGVVRGRGIVLLLVFAVAGACTDASRDGSVQERESPPGASTVPSPSAEGTPRATEPYNEDFCLHVHDAFVLVTGADETADELARIAQSIALDVPAMQTQAAAGLAEATGKRVAEASADVRSGNFTAEERGSFLDDLTRVITRAC